MKFGSRLQWKISLLFLLLLLIGFWAGDSARQAGTRTTRSVLFALSALGLWAAFHFGLSRVLTRPLADINEVVKKFGEGLFNWRVRLDDRRDEIAEPGFHLNRLAENLGERIEKLSKALAETEALLEEMEEGVLILDLHGRVQKVNGAMEAILSHAYPADMGKHYLEVFRDPELNEIIQATLREKKGQRRSFSPLGQPEKTFQVQSSLVEYPQGGGEGVVVVFHDITDLKRLERIRRDFVANVSHELRTPLTEIRGSLEALVAQGGEDGSLAEPILSTIRGQTERMEKIVSDLLLLSEMESPDRLLKRERLHVGDLISAAVNSLRPLAESKKQTLLESVASDLPPTRGDGERIRQAITNLLHNSISYTPEQGHIRIEAGAVERGVEVSVSDTGIGIPSVDLPRVFERFYRVDKRRSRDAGGTGLGLSIVRHIVEAHGGWIRAESKPGQGSRFTFFLPQG